jgi:predicted enzyme related to lactoylglutathione lyase
VLRLLFQGVLLGALTVAWRLKMRTTSWVLAGTLAGMTAVTGCASGKAGTAPSGAVPAASDTVGRFVWHDLVTRDAAACQKFYGALLGWEFEATTSNGRPYVLARSGGEFAGGIVQREEMKTEPAAWLSYLSVPDLDGALGRVTSAGGKVLFPPTPIGAYGRVVVVLDPQGAPLGLASVTGTLPAEPAQPPLRQFFWMEYLAKDGPAALAFYEGLAGYESTVTASEHGLDYHVLKRQRSRAGLLQIPSGFENVAPNWLPYIRVEDPAALARKALSLGGQVVLEPRADVRGGTLAIVTDPTGGAIALQRFPL